MSEFKAPVLVTGGSGYLASWIIAQLLEAGATVHTTVRNPAQTDKYQHLLDLAGQHPGTLKVFAADLLSPGSFAEAMQGCETVMHTASPFVTSGIGDPQKELVEPALLGTRSVLETVNQQEQVQRVVLTSSVVSIYGDATDLRQTAFGRFTEEDWNQTSSLKHQPYSLSKTLAEKEAWKMHKAQNRWQLSVINPGFILGPSLTNRKDSTSIDFMLKMANGTYLTGVPHLVFGLVDVRDVARAHLQAALLGSNGRHILVNESLDLWQIAQILKQKFGRKYPFPLMPAPKWLVKLIGPAQGLTREFVNKNVGFPLPFDNRRSKKDLQIVYRPTAETLVDQLEQLVRDGLL
ncbi:diaminohydroxyphosphoribosylaminopyrimidine deaminase [bacterium (Candidatus Blackallbacteria) CG17_big_fil_post_rev_8_21_14_2_50_48_46]|uniref:Diaminohydroxyphosphoribosylaminopyrimidine deaminase n=1 Tax=bacterium (Candidatus Blackallbacteria) CG17_big_fil_post_rev_8_21_14_2_50_48_46 TaxID=2014261 RepID=A0A2M7GAY5_9BACT|nr:MAG: diaminohydroxyphosphoribosylaminopyrimidine deaminase [bacterium (Candidatus Blackallbacteria) CG18_big_fil_WC_8_21_14_2_50_49_26]PIW19087.1 MAG: diaminohydroxyphosphoribosylaminopyrimidine deaminase [bacterium (Candidatus Blackallbacteria) CG17_big_fil_post_rev_8_21_14_2_50_48_46]PIW44546.1 MAG: diaminohydroxyphosphoribosylaminopyrimidine deaminase [bacterium (Candidatus Blackallbacteria) CG13_big_fil_rev_8_21_14_2_50_49_14]